MYYNIFPADKYRLIIIRVTYSQLTTKYTIYRSVTTQLIVKEKHLTTLTEIINLNQKNFYITCAFMLNS